MYIKILWNDPLNSVEDTNMLQLTDPVGVRMCEAHLFCTYVHSHERNPWNLF